LFSSCFIDNNTYILRRNIQFSIICPIIDILYMRTTTIHEGKLMQIQLLIYLAVWGALATFGLCLLAIAKRKVPISIEEAKVLWKIHKHDTNCSRHKWKPLTERNGKITGFKCECGHQYSQRGHFLSSKPKCLQMQEKARMTSAKSIATFYASANQREEPEPVAIPNRARANRKSLLK
jgi:hypothetical protein